jgi:type II secretory pathway pseudopilin PulG
MKIKKPNMHKKGQSLIEVVFMVGVSFLILTGLVAAVIFSIKAASYSKNKALATRLAREKMEELKSDKQASSFWGTSEVVNNNCLSDETDVSGVTGFTRRTCFSNYSNIDNDYKTDVTIEVWWTPTVDPGVGVVKVESRLSNWER